MIRLYLFSVDIRIYWLQAYFTWSGGYYACNERYLYVNAAVWTFYCGEHGLIDAVPNKPTIAHCRPKSLPIPGSNLRKSCRLWPCHKWPEKKVNAILPHCIVLSSKALMSPSFSPWKGITRLRLPSRTKLLYAVQLLNTQGQTVWMDGVVSPGERRTVLLEKPYMSLP